MSRRSYQRHIAEMSRLGDWHDQYLYMERRLMRSTLLWGVLPSLAAIPVAATHGMPTAASVAAGAALAAAFVVAALRWPMPHRWVVASALIVLDLWPSLLWPYWWFVAASMVLGFLIFSANCRSLYRRARRYGWLLVPPWAQSSQP